MPWHQEPMKDVISCEKLWGGANIHYIHRYPNEGTQTGEKPVYLHISKVVCKKGTWGTETSKYPQEKKENSIP